MSTPSPLAGPSPEHEPVDSPGPGPAASRQAHVKALEEHAESCLYCDMPLSPRHEHDHFPIPFRHGGTQVFCVCVNCHDLKDRTNLGDFPALVLRDWFELWPKLTARQRILFAKLVVAGQDFVASAVNTPTGE